MAVPLMASTFIQSIVLITDSSFLSRFDILAYDAVGNGGLIYITLFMALVGLNDGSQILMARRIGESKEKILPQIFGSSLLSNLLITILLFVLISSVLPNFILDYSKNNIIAQGQIDYIHYRSYGLFFASIALAINAYFMAIGRTTFVLYSAIFIAVSNIGLDYLLIFGNGSIPALGIKGAAIASTLADGVGALFLIIALFFSKSQRYHQLIKHLSFGYKNLIALFKISSPIMLQGFIALFTWTIFFTWIEQIGTFELTVSQNIRSLYFLAFVPVWGFGATTKTFVSHYIGKKDYVSVKIIIKKIQILTLAFTFLFFHGAILYPEEMISLVNPNDIYIKESASILRFVFGAVILYGASSIYFQAINGTGNTRVNFFIELIAVIIYLMVAYILIKVLEMNIFWIWSVEYYYFTTIGLLSFIYIRFFNWKKKII